MIETFTPAVCGSRIRRRIAVFLFAVAAVGSAASLGALLGLAGEALGARRALFAAAALALLAAAREAELVRVPLPQARRQVPERWRFELPLPVWATGYGAGLGAGVFTYQPVSTFWVAGAAALALARPLPAALSFSLYGAGRALTLVWTRRAAGEPGEVAERLSGRRGQLLKLNAATLVACGTLLALAPAAQGALIGAGLDPTVDMGVVAYGRQDGTVLVRAPGGSLVIAGAREPAIDGDLLAYRSPAGIRVVRWQTGEVVAGVDGALSLPALDWPRLAFVRDEGTRRRLVVRNLATGAATVVATVQGRTDLGRPSLRHGRLAWHVANREFSRLNLLTLSTGRRRVLAASKIVLLGNPALHRSHVAWVEQRSGVASVRVAWTWGGKPRILARIRSRGASFWTTALAHGKAYATRWSLATRAASVHSFSH